MYERPGEQLAAWSPEHLVVGLIGRTAHIRQPARQCQGKSGDNRRCVRAQCAPLLRNFRIGDPAIRSLRRIVVYPRRVGRIPFGVEGYTMALLGRSPFYSPASGRRQNALRASRPGRCERAERESCEAGDVHRAKSRPSRRTEAIGHRAAATGTGGPGSCAAARGISNQSGKSHVRVASTAGGDRAGSRSRRSVGRPIWRRMRSTIAGSSMVAIRRSRPPHCAHASRSIAKMRRRRSAHAQ
jgi:hypothetical protein